MAGPIFVLDAESQPLMPIAAAHARKLLRSGKARVYPHPTLTVLQLTRIVEQPILRPIVLGLRILQKTAELFVLAAGPQHIFPLLSVVIDLSQIPCRRRRRRIGRHQHWCGPCWTHIRAIGSVISLLWTLLPLSHIVILRSPNLHRVRPGWLRRLFYYLAVENIYVMARKDSITVPGMTAELYATLTAFADQSQHQIPVMIAIPIAPQYSRRLTKLIVGTVAPTPLPRIEVAVTPTITGIIDLDGADTTMTLRVPVAVDAAGVVWQYITVPPSALVQRWSLSSVGMIPLQQQEKGSHRRSVGSIEEQIGSSNGAKNPG